MIPHWLRFDRPWPGDRLHVRVNDIIAIDEVRDGSVTLYLSNGAILEVGKTPKQFWDTVNANPDAKMMLL